MCGEGRLPSLRYATGYVQMRENFKVERCEDGANSM
jgi:hypothetical protein